LITIIAVQRSQAATAASATCAFTTARTDRVRIVMGQHIDIISIYRRHLYYRAFGPTTTRVAVLVSRSVDADLWD